MKWFNKKNLARLTIILILDFLFCVSLYFYMTDRAEQGLGNALSPLEIFYLFMVIPLAIPLDLGLLLGIILLVETATGKKDAGVE